jgi:formylglycine-generating enzyme required for sulfatase activity
MTPPFKTHDAAEMVLVPEGPFTLGITDDQLYSLGYDKAAVAKWRNQYGERYALEQRLPAYFIDRHLVTNQQYRQFMQESNRSRKPRVLDSDLWGDPGQPVVAVNWTDATEYAAWVGERLPSEEEWEKAARGTDARIFPWGDDFTAPRCNCYEAGLDCTSIVGGFPDSASPYGVHDLAGNVWEMTTGRWDNERFVMRGGAYLTYIRFCRTTARWVPSDKELLLGPTWLGFRCVRDA